MGGARWAWSDDGTLGTISPDRARRRGQRAGHRRLPDQRRAPGHARPAVPRRHAQPAVRTGRRTARPAGAADRHRLPHAGRGPAVRHGPAAVRDRVRQPAGGRRRPRLGLRAGRQRRSPAAAAGTRRRARGLADGPDQPRVRGGRAAAGGVRCRAAAGVLARAAAAAVPLHERQGPDRVDDRHRAHRARRAARDGAAGLPAVQRLPPDRVPETPLRPGQDRDRGRPGTAAADYGAERHVPGRGPGGGGAEVLLVRPVRDARAGDQRRDAGRTAARAARRPGAARAGGVSFSAFASPCGGGGRGGAARSRRAG